MWEGCVDYAGDGGGGGGGSAFDRMLYLRAISYIRMTS